MTQLADVRYSKYRVLDGHVGSNPTTGTQTPDSTTTIWCFDSRQNYTARFAYVNIRLGASTMTRSYDDYRRILALHEEGYNKSEMERMLGIPRATIRDCIKKFDSLQKLEQYIEENPTCELLDLLKSDFQMEHDAIYRAYTYTLGIYLGDGTINKVRNVYRLRVFLDAKYPQIIETCARNIKTLLPENDIGFIERYEADRLSMITVVSYYKYFPEIFPQSGVGMKHTRPIILEDWQIALVNKYPLECLRGLYHSDGSRFDNVVKGKAYPRYQFSNVSMDIIRIFCYTCDLLKIHYTSKSKPSRGRSSMDIFISRRPDVEYLDSVIGAKC